jgi:probable F420-dependent oxidoreductase
VKIGLHLPQWGDLASRSAVLAIAKAAEEAGLDSVWVADHIVYPTESQSTYPYRAKGLPFGPDEGFLEAVTQLAVVAGATETVELGTSVLVLPMREPLLAAKMFATLDVLSTGRVVIAVGAGWWREEFELVGAAFEGRGARMDEQLDILRAAWTSGEVGFSGKHYELPSAVSRPLPIRPGGPPVLIGGNGPASWRRAATRGAGWHAVGLAPAELINGQREIQRLAQAIGRDPSDLLFSTSTGTGRTPADTVRRIETLEDAGIRQVVLNLPARSPTLSDYMVCIEEIATKVLPQLRGTSHAPVRR